MPTFKNIRIKMKGGKTRTQRVKVLASGKYKFVKNIGGKGRKKKTSRTRKTTVSRRRGVRRMTRRKKPKARRKIAIAPLLGIVGGVAEPIRRVMAGDIGGAIHELRNTVTGFDEFGKFNPQWLSTFWGPVIVGCLMHKFVGGWPINANRYLKGLPIQL